MQENISSHVTEVPILTSDMEQTLHGIVTPHLSDNLQRQTGVVGLHKFNKTGKLVGTALTVKTRPGDNLYIYKAMTLLKPGHVLVVDAGGEISNACVGEIMKRYLQTLGCKGVIVNGAIRDVSAFENDDFPCYAKGISHRGPYKDGPGLINVPVNIGGQVIQPGDVIVGDEDGIVCFPLAEAYSLIQKAQQHAEKEKKIMKEIEQRQSEQSWLHPILKNKGLL